MGGERKGREGNGKGGEREKGCEGREFILYPRKKKRKSQCLWF